MRDSTGLHRPVVEVSLPAKLIRNINMAALPKWSPDTSGAEEETDKQKRDTGKADINIMYSASANKS